MRRARESPSPWERDLEEAGAQRSGMEGSAAIAEIAGTVHRHRPVRELRPGFEQAADDQDFVQAKLIESGDCKRELIDQYAAFSNRAGWPIEAPFSGTACRRPAYVRQLRAHCSPALAARLLHHGATSQDLVGTGMIEALGKDRVCSCQRLVNCWRSLPIWLP